LRDLCGLDPAEAEETLRWGALAMLAAAASGDSAESARQPSWPNGTRRSSLPDA
jgi:hypothetical protein